MTNNQTIEENQNYILLGLDLSQIKRGNVFKNYNELCMVLNISNKSGSAKTRQLEELSRFIKLKQNGHQLKVTKIYNPPKPKITKEQPNKKKYDNFHVSLEDEKKHGVYRIIDEDNNIYIGYTCNKQGFRGRFVQHMNINCPTPHTHELIHKGCFEIIEICEGMTRKEVIQREDYWIEYYKRLENWNVINIYNSPIEYGRPKRKTIKIEIYEDDIERVTKEIKKIKGVINIQ